MYGINLYYYINSSWVIPPFFIQKKKKKIKNVKYWINIQIKTLKLEKVI